MIWVSTIWTTKFGTKSVTKVGKSNDHGRRSCCCWCEKHSTNTLSMGPLLVLLPHQCKLSLFIRKIVYAQNARALINYKIFFMFGYSLTRVLAHRNSPRWHADWSNDVIDGSSRCRIIFRCRPNRTNFWWYKFSYKNFSSERVKSFVLIFAWW
jgi:hypothetical protein